MSFKLMLGSVFFASVLSFSGMIHASEDASMHEVYLAAEAGKFGEAQAMMDKVLRDHPNSAKAHYVEAELLAKQGQLSGASSELSTAEKLDPGLPFVKPQTLQNLKAQIGSSSIPVNAHSSGSNGIPWGMVFLIGGLILFIIVVARLMSQRNPTVISSNYPGNSPYGGGYSGYGGGPIIGQPGGGLGSGILGGLATGAAVGAGMVAGEELMHHFTDGDRGNSGFINEAQAGNSWDNQNDMGGSDFGIADSSSWDDNSVGGDDWT